MQIVLVILLFSLAIAGWWWSVRWQYRRADTLLSEWAARNGYTIVAKEDASPAGTGPKGTRTGTKRIVYRVSVVEQGGTTRQALVTLGSYSAGVTASEVSVEWQ
jgi:hypothetical protein